MILTIPEIRNLLEGFGYYIKSEKDYEVIQKYKGKDGIRHCCFYYPSDVDNDHPNQFIQFTTWADGNTQLTFWGIGISYLKRDNKKIPDKLSIGFNEIVLLKPDWTKEKIEKEVYEQQDRLVKIRKKLVLEKIKNIKG